MYTPQFNDVTDEVELREMVAAIGSGWLVTVGADGVPTATLLPVMWQGDRLVMHMAKANEQWCQIEPGTIGLVICPGPEAYISPSWYGAKTEHGRVVPTWNYTAVHLIGTLSVHHGAGWLRTAVTELTDIHERTQPEAWRVTDAPAAYIDAQLNGIVGIEVTIQRVEGKAKLSQNRATADQRGVIAGLRSGASAGAHAIADEMAARLR